MRPFAVLLLLTIAHPAAAQETTTYTYDALGRLTGSTVSGGTASGTKTAITYDQAGNRARYEVTGSQSGGDSGGGSGGDGAGVPGTGGTGGGIAPKRFIVVPLNGYTVIQL